MIVYSLVDWHLLFILIAHPQDLELQQQPRLNRRSTSGASSRLLPALLCPRRHQRNARANPSLTLLFLSRSSLVKKKPKATEAAAAADPNQSGHRHPQLP